MIEVEELSKVYEGAGGAPVEALGGVSFKVEPGTVFGLLGPNGAGKTTLLRIVATMLRPTGGTARVGGVDIRTDPEGVRRRIGFLSATTGLYERLTPRETIAWFGRLHGLDEAAVERRSDELIALLDMSAFCDRLCGTLSAGQRQKTSIARALVHDPPVLIFDEPTANLDVLVARAVLQRVAALKGANRTIVLSTHVLVEAEKMCDRIAIVHRGKLLALGTRDEVVARGGEGGLEEAFFALVGESRD